jgi:hypothetical protein
MATGRIPTTANSPLTVKGDLFGYSTTQARVPVGNDGETLVADSSTSTGLRYQAISAAGKNAVINGGFDVWQRGTSISLAASTAATYTTDRFQSSSGASQATTISRQSTNDTTNLPNIQYCARIQRNSGQTGTGGIPFVSSMETANCIPYAGKAIVYSFYARAGSNFSSASNALTVYLISGTGTDQNRLTGAYTGETLPVNTTATLTTTWQRFTYTATLPTNCSEFASFFQFTPSGTAGANDYFEVTGVQIELGSVATSFSRAAATIQGELNLCYRYFQRIQDNSGGVDGYLGVAIAYGTTGAYTVMPFLGTFRTTPSTTFTSGNLEVLTAAGATASLSAVGVQTPTTTLQLIGGTTSGLTSGQALLMRSGTVAYVLDISAEL